MEFLRLNQASEPPPILFFFTKWQLEFTHYSGKKTISICNITTTPKP